MLSLVALLSRSTAWGWLLACAPAEAPSTCTYQGGHFEGVYAPDLSACLVGALGDCEEASGVWEGEGCPTFPQFVDDVGGGDRATHVVSILCNCVGADGHRYHDVTAVHQWSDSGRTDRVVFDAVTGATQWITTDLGVPAADQFCCYPEERSSPWLVYGLPVPLDCSEGTEDTAIGPHDEICGAR